MYINTNIIKGKFIEPSIEPGNQLCKGIWADFAIAPVSNRIPIIVENTKTNEISEYISLIEASKVLGVHSTTVGQAITYNRLIKKTYRVSKKVGGLNN